MKLLEWLVTTHLHDTTFDSFAEWHPAFLRGISGWNLPLEWAVVGGCVGDRLAYAFAAGYQSALRRLFPFLPIEKVASFCVTEAGGGHPRAIQCQLIQDADQWLIHGEKTFVTSANEAEILIITASQGIDEFGQNHISVIQIPHDTDGAIIETLPDMPFVPEISHGKVILDHCPISSKQLLAGDGYLNYIKPFRTVEDLHVFAGILGYLFRVATLHQLDTRLREDILACIVTAHHLAGMFASKTPVHLALAGFIRQFRTLILAFEFHLVQVDEATRSRWMRDKQLFTIAESVREKRRESAWEKVNA